MFIFLSFPPPFLSAFHCSASDPSRCFGPANTHLGCPPIFFGTGHGVIPGCADDSQLGDSSESAGVVRRKAPGSDSSLHSLHFDVRLARGGTRRPLSLPRPRPASPVPTDPSCCRISQERAITSRQHNTLAASRRCLVSTPVRLQMQT